MFNTILIANRGEIACRIIRSARALGYRTVAVYSEADRGAPHVLLADEAVAIGPAPPAQSYLHIGRVIDACLASRADALHPGYGFLSENAALAQACIDAGIVFIGPSPRAMRVMGDKAAARRCARAAGVPCIPGYDDPDRSDGALAAAAAALGAPLMIKAVAGGGGRGLRRVDDLRDFAAALAAARSEAVTAFGCGDVLLERALDAPRHIEIQIIADHHGTVAHLGERECSLQRRHQKIIEESPAPAVTPALRAAMGAAAVALARSIGYAGAGTLEFLVDRDGAFHFMEMNTRLQVEHAVTEMVTGLDLVALQIRIAQGERLPFGQAAIGAHGHAIEVRLCAEDADRGFLPCTGTVWRWRVPCAEGVRVDHALAEGRAVTAHYDPLLAKIIAHGATRAQARRRLLRALDACVLLGVTTNREFLAECLSHPAFVAGEFATDFVGRHCADREPPPMDIEARGAAALILVARRWTAAARDAALAWWRSSGDAVSYVALEADGQTADVRITAHADRWFTVAAGDESARLRVMDMSDAEARIEYDGATLGVPFALAEDGTLHLRWRARAWSCRDASRDAPRPAESDDPDGVLRPPMNGHVAALLVKAGEAVRRGQPLVVIESMKIEQALAAPRAGIVGAIQCRVGEQVSPERVLLRIAPALAP